MINAALESVLRRDRYSVGFALALVTALAWSYVLWLAAHMADADISGMDMAGMTMGDLAAPAFKPWTAGAGPLFVGGVMNVLWIAGITAVVLVEKSRPTDASRAFSAQLC